MDSKSSHIDESGLYESIEDSALGDLVNEDLVPATSETNSLVHSTLIVPAEISAKTVEKVPVIDLDKPCSEDVEEVDPLQINTGIEQPAITNTVTKDTSAVINDLPVNEDVPMPENPPLKLPQVFSPAMELQQLQAAID